MADALVVKFGKCRSSLVHLLKRFLNPLTSPFFLFLFKESLYTSEKHGDDSAGDGSEAKPFKSVLKAMKTANAEPFPSKFQSKKLSVD